MYFFFHFQTFLFIFFLSNYLTYLVLNEINQHAHRSEEKPAQFKLPDICQPVSIKNGKFLNCSSFIWYVQSIRLKDQPEKGISTIDIELEPVKYHSSFTNKHLHDALMFSLSPLSIFNDCYIFFFFFCDLFSCLPCSLSYSFSHTFPFKRVFQALASFLYLLHKSVHL